MHGLFLNSERFDVRILSLFLRAFRQMRPSTITRETAQPDESRPHVNPFDLSVDDHGISYCDDEPGSALSWFACEDAIRWEWQPRS